MAVKPASTFVSSLGMWGLNVTSGVCIIMVNKVLLGAKDCDFAFATCLCALHFLVTSLASELGTKVGVCPKQEQNAVQFSARDLWTFTVVANLSIVSLNTSLMINSIMLYQVSKLAIVPFSCLVEMAWYGRRFSGATVFFITLTLIGMAMVSISEFKVSSSVLGVGAALASIVFAGLQQLLCRHYQKQYDMPSNVLLAKTAFAQGSTLLLFGPFLDRIFSDRWITDYEFTDPRTPGMLLLSSFLALGVNFSQFLVLGRFSAVTFQVMGHLKTLLVLLLGGWLFGGVVSTTQMVGMSLAVSGMIGYGWSTSGPSPKEPAAKEKELSEAIAADREPLTRDTSEPSP
jgi:solute carrier family 35 protein E3